MIIMEAHGAARAEKRRESEQPSRFKASTAILSAAAAAAVARREQRTDQRGHSKLNALLCSA